MTRESSELGFPDNVSGSAINLNGEHGKAIFGNKVVNVVNNIYTLPGAYEQTLTAPTDPALSSRELTKAVLDSIDSTPRIKFSELADMSQSSFQMIVDDLRSGRLLIEWDRPSTSRLSESQSPSASQLMDVASFDTRYYQLIVTTQEDVFDSNIVHMMASRALGSAYVPDEIFETCSELTPQGIERLKRIPAVICKENTGRNGETDPSQMATYARIKAILPSHKIIDIVFEPIGVFPQKKMCEPIAAAYFGLNMDCCITTLNHTAWSVMQRNLFEAFREAGIEGMPAPRSEQ